MPGIIRNLGNKTYHVQYFLCFLMLLVGAVFTYTPEICLQANLRISGCQCMDMGNLRSDLCLLSGGHVVRLIRSSERFIRFPVRFCFYQQSEYLRIFIQGYQLTILILATV